MLYTVNVFFFFYQSIDLDELSKDVWLITSVYVCNIGVGWNLALLMKTYRSFE